MGFLVRCVMELNGVDAARVVLVAVLTHPGTEVRRRRMNSPTCGRAQQRLVLLGAKGLGDGNAGGGFASQGSAEDGTVV